MLRLEELEERVTALERSRKNSIINIDKANSTAIRFYASSYYVDIDIAIMSNAPVSGEYTLNGVTHKFDSNFVHERLDVESDNTLVVKVVSEGLLSKRIKIEGIGVKLLSV